MAIDSTHPKYDRYLERWQRCRHAAEGGDSIKDQGTLYLPRLTGQNDSEYQAYKKRALWYGATSRTIAGLRGAVFRKDPAIEFPDAGVDMLERITDDNLDLISLASEVLTEQLVAGRIGLLVDMPPGNFGEPYISRYIAEDIIMWRTETVGGKEKLTLLVLREVFENPGDDEFEIEEKIRYRVLRLDGGLYTQEEWDEERGLRERFEPTRLGKRLDFIPFRFINATSLSASPEKPPLIDVVDVNLSHYRTSADLEHGAHFTALPTPWLAGFPVDKTFAIGSGVAFVTDNTQAKAGMLEFTGKGLDTLIAIKQAKENLMAVLGARLLEEQKKGIEAAETVRLRSSGESGALSAVTKTASRGLSDVLQWVAWWRGLVASLDNAAEAARIELNQDFLNERLTAQELTALLQALQGGAISMNTWLYNLERGEILPPGTDLETEIDMISTEAGTPEVADASETMQQQGEEGV